MIRFDAAGKRYGEIEALAPVDLDVHQGEWLGVVGRNGSGKSTLLRLLVGLSRPSCGRILLDGNEPDAEAWRRFRFRLGFMPERVAFFEHLTGERVLGYIARLKKADPESILPLLSQVGLEDAAGRKVSGYSKGMRQRLNLAQALLGDPEVLVLDEPIEGLDAHGVQDFFELLRGTFRRTVVFTSHRLQLIASRVDRVAVLRGGRLQALGTEEELYRRADLPARVVIQPKPGAGAVLDAMLARVEAATLTSRNGRFVLSVPQEHKLRLLAGLEGLADSISSLRVEEPTLEEVLLETS